MKVHLKWIGAAAAIAAAGLNFSQASAQYAPYRPQQPAQAPTAGYPTTGQPAYAPVAGQPYGRYQQPAPQAAVPQAPQVAVPQVQVTQAQAPYAPSVPYQGPAAAYQAPVATPHSPYPQTAAQMPAYAYPRVAEAPRYPETPVAPSYPTYGYQLAGQSTPPVPPAPTANESLPAPVPEPSTAPAAASPPTAPIKPSTQVSPAVPGGSAVTNGSAHPSAGYQTGSGYTDYGISGYCEEDCDSGAQWYGGVYFLYMERDDPNALKLAVSADAAAEPYPLAHRTVLSTYNADYDYQEGMEIRFGSTFSVGDSCDDGYGTTCGGAGYGGAGRGPAPTNFAWEAALWALDDDSNWATAVDYIPDDSERIHGMRDFAGLQFNGQAVNDFFGSGLPLVDPNDPINGSQIVVLAQRVRTDFSASNLELNFIRFPVCNVACGTGGGCGNSCGYDTCGYDTNGCEPVCTPIAFSMYGLCGVRYLRADDDFCYATEFADISGGAPDPPFFDGFNGDVNELYYNVQVDNNLLGPQVGWNMNYCVASRWNFFLNSTFGIFNNHIQQHKRMYSSGGVVQFAAGGETFNLRSSTNDVSFLGELRLGGAYDISCNWRAVLAYRALAITGFANSADNFGNEFSNAEYARMIYTDGSLVLHGLQVGTEFRY